MLTYKPEVAQKLRTAAAAIERIGQLMPERAQSACQECSAILAVCADEYAPKPPAPPKYPDSARENARKVAAQAKPTGVGYE